MKERETGYYRVKLGDNWDIAFWDGMKTWTFPGFTEDFEDSDFNEIEIRPINIKPLPYISLFKRILNKLMCKK